MPSGLICVLMVTVHYPLRIHYPQLGLCQWRANRIWPYSGRQLPCVLIRGMSTMPLDPIVIHFFIHDCDIHSIHPAILGEWHPRLRQTISDWLRLGPHGNPAPFQEHFATFHDLQVRRRAAEMF